jgi:hypothetical protein
MTRILMITVTLICLFSFIKLNEAVKCEYKKVGLLGQTLDEEVFTVTCSDFCCESTVACCLTDFRTTKIERNWFILHKWDILVILLEWLVVWIAVVIVFRCFESCKKYFKNEHKIKKYQPLPELTKFDIDSPMLEV